jgi:hypothetical protein
VGEVSIAAPHPPQNLLSGGLAWLHAGQSSASGVPQAPQKRFSPGFSCAHFGQFTTEMPCELLDSFALN